MGEKKIKVVKVGSRLEIPVRIPPEKRGLELVYENNPPESYVARLDRRVIELVNKDL